MLGVNACVCVVAIMFSLCEGLNVRKGFAFGDRDIILFCTGFFFALGLFGFWLYFQVEASGLMFVVLSRLLFVKLPLRIFYVLKLT